MISTLVIGGGSRSGEIALSNGCHPRLLRSRILDLHEARESIVVQTWCPLVIFEVTACWISDSESGWLERVLFRLATGSDVHLVAVRAPDWLAHFSLADLYMHGEFDDLLGGEVDDKP